MNEYFSRLQAFLRNERARQNLIQEIQFIFAAFVGLFLLLLASLTGCKQPPNPPIGGPNGIRRASSRGVTTLSVPSNFAKVRNQ